MRVFKGKAFARFARKERIPDRTLCAATDTTNKGLIDADLGGGVIKQRIGRPGEGKSGGYRSIILFRREDKAFFVHGFAKSAVANLEPNELKAFKLLAGEMLRYDQGALAKALGNGTLIEVICNGDQDLS
jgi:hypothetical protein